MDIGSDRIMADAQDPPQRDLHGEARSLIAAARAATLATVTAGVPYAALVTPAFLPDGAALLLLSQLSAHTRHLQAAPACALLITGEATTENPQTAPRLCLTGAAAQVSGPDFRTAYLTKHPYAALYIDFTDFTLWRLDFSAAHYIGGFAAAAKLDPAKLRAP
jgi:putative heme iron utilization protein